MDQLQSEGVKLSLKPNYKTYYGGFPHIVRFHYKAGRQDWATVRNLHRRVLLFLKDSLDPKEYRTRSEYYNMSVYCYDIQQVLNAIPASTLKSWGNVELGEMAEIVQEESSIKPELPKAKTTVVKKLPYDTWRYRVYWGSLYKIGLEAVSAIIDQINNDPNTKGFDEKTTERLKRGSYWGTSYFYTNSEDVLCLITLITPLFIKRIEKFTTLEELNEKRTS